MRRYYLATVLGLLVPTLGWWIGLEAQIGLPTRMSRWVFEAYQQKTQIASATSSPRVLLVAGSNVLFGLDSAELSRVLGLPVVNMGVNAGLGLHYILWQARRVARASDMIIMPLEYSLYVDDDQPNAQIVDYALAREPDYWHELSPWRKVRVAAALSFERWSVGLRGQADLPVVNGHYGGRNIDSLGDQTHTSPADRTVDDIAEVASSRVWDYGARAKTSNGGWRQLAAFARWAQISGVCLAAIPPSLLMHSRYRDDPVERGFYDGLPSRVRALGIPYLGRPLDFMYPADWFFNTDYHLQDWARGEHTRRILNIDGLAPAVRCRQM